MDFERSYEGKFDPPYFCGVRYHAATRSNHAYTLSTKSEARQKHDMLTFKSQSYAKFDAKNNFFDAPFAHGQRMGAPR